MSTIEHGINLGLAGDWVARVEYDIFPGRPATRWEPEDAAEVSISRICLRPDAPMPKGGYRWIDLPDDDLFGVLADELSGDDGFLEKVAEDMREANRCAAEDLYDSQREQRLLDRE